MAPGPVSDVLAAAAHEGEAAAQRHALWCQNEGPIARLWQAYGEMEKRMRFVEAEQAESRGSVKEMAKSGQRTVLIIGAIGVAIQLAAFALTHWPNR